MEAIKKKVQAMKVEKDNLCDRCDEVEQVGLDISLNVVVISIHNIFLENEGVPHPKGQG